MKAISTWARAKQMFLFLVDLLIGLLFGWFTGLPGMGGYICGMLVMGLTHPDTSAWRTALIAILPGVGLTFVATLIANIPGAKQAFTIGLTAAGGYWVAMAAGLVLERFSPPEFRHADRDGSL